MVRHFDKDFCLSSYMAFRYIWKDDYDFFPGFSHENFEPQPLASRIPVRSAEEIGRKIQQQVEKLYEQYGEVGILLSGGMDSAIIASYLHPGSHAYTFISDTGVFNADVERARAYCQKYDLQHHLIEISFEDYQKYTPIVMARKWAPVHSIEPQIYKAAISAKKDGVKVILVGESADLIFGGMDQLISRDWFYEDFIKRYTFLEPEKVLEHPVSMIERYESYRMEGDKIDYMRFMDDVFSIESSGSYYNAFGAAMLPYFDPYACMTMAEPLDMSRVRNGEPKYLIRELYATCYPERDIPFKIPMPRPVDAVFRDWAGPSRPEFKKSIDMNTLTGNQKWQLWCAELFLNLYDE